jgi:hypothetical protein
MSVRPEADPPPGDGGMGGSPADDHLVPGPARRPPGRICGPEGRSRAPGRAGTGTGAALRT